MSFFVKPVNVDVAAILAQVELLHGEDPGVGTATENWNSGVATSGGAGGDVCTIGANDTRYKLHAGNVSMRNLTPGANVTVRAYMQVNGVEDEFYNQTFVQGTDPDDIPWCNGTMEIHEAVRVELHSDQGADDGANVPFDYSLEAM
jgi:hypothetical protein